jgi:hypothetical protein
VFVLAADGQSVRWREVQVGIRDGNRVQVMGEDLATQVVTLGQQLLDDNSRVSIAAGQRGPDP